MKSQRIFALAAAAGVALALSAASVAIAAGSPVEERQATMKAVGQTMKEATAFTAAATPYDAAKVKALMDGLAADAKKLKGLYPAGSGADPKTAADPKIWENKADFDKRLAEMGAAAAAAGKSADTASFKTSFKAVSDTCKSCHDIYRMKKKAG